MKFYYDTLPVHDLGEITVSQRREAEGGPDAPQRFKLTTTLGLATFADGYAANASLLDQLRNALQKQSAQVQWSDDNGRDYLKQTVTLVSEDLPETWGEYHQRAEVVFYHYEQALQTGNLPCTFTSAGGKGFSFTNVLRWKRADSISRISPLHSARRLGEERIAIEGWLLGDPTVELNTRRDALNRQCAQLIAELNGAEGVLTLGDAGKFFNRTVRIENFEADVDQAVNQIPFRLTAQWTPYGGDPDFSITDFSVSETEPFTGEQFLRLAGKITAATEDVARTAYADLVADVLKNYGYAAAQPLKDEATANSVTSPDGTVFTELSFNAEYRRFRADNLTAIFTPDNGEGVPLPNILKWKRADTTERVSPLHRHRRLTQERIAVEGVILSDATKSVAERRAWLDNKLAEVTSVTANAQGTLTFGKHFSQVVKVENFEAAIDQELYVIPYAFTAQWVPYPNPDDFAIIDFSVGENEAFTGEQFLRLTGKIMADTEDHARTALAGLVADTLAAYAYTAAQPLREEATAASVTADADGTTFIELPFSYEWRRLRADNLTAVITLPTSQIVLPNVLDFKRGTTIERVSPVHPQRRMVVERVTGRGVLASDPALSVAARRAWLANQQARLDGLNQQSAPLVIAPFYDQTVKFTEFRADIDAALFVVNYAFATERQVFPNPDDFAITDFTVTEQTQPDGQNTGEQFLRLSGKVVAVDEATARAVLADLKTAIATQYPHYPQPLRDEATAGSTIADTDGTVFTELSFNAEWRGWRSDNLSATFRQTGHTGSPVSLGQIRTQSLRYSAQRMNEHKSQRAYAGGRVELAGTFPGDMTKPLTARRKQLDDQLALLYAEVNGADGELIYGAGFSKVVRVDDFHAEINQKITGIEWTLTASWSEFPNDTGFATTEFTVTPRVNEEDGDETIAFAGRIRSTTKAQALAKLVVLRASVLTTYGYTDSQRLHAELNYGSFYANDDTTAGLAEPIAQESAGTGTAFAELNFNEEYRRRRTGFLTWAMKVSSRDDVPAGLRLTTYAGTVSAGGDTVDAAYAAAKAKALALGGDKQAAIGDNTFLRVSTLDWDQRQVRTDNAVEFVRLSFSYEYQSKLAAGRAYYELTVETQNNPFEVNTVSVSGTITGASDAELDATYAAIKTGYAGQLFRSERTARQTVHAAAENVTQVLRLEFSFVIYCLKAAGQISYRYGLSVEKDYLQLSIARRLHGSVWAATADAAAIAWKALADSLALGVLLRENAETSFNWTAATAANNDKLGMFERSDFDWSYADRLTGIAGVLELSVSEDVTYTAPRWLLLPALATPSNPQGLDVPQTFSTQSGSRKVSGEVTAATLATAEAWAKKQRVRLTGDADGVKIFEPEQWSRSPVFLPRTENVQLYRVRFTFSERLRNYPAPT